MRDLATDPVYINYREGVSEHLVSLHFHLLTKWAI